MWSKQGLFRNICVYKNTPMHAIKMKREDMNLKGELGGAMGRFEGRSVCNYNTPSKIK